MDIKGQTARQTGTFRKIRRQTETDKHTDTDTETEANRNRQRHIDFQTDFQREIHK